MSVTVLEALQNANYNFKTNLPFGVNLAKNQLNNAVTLLEKGYGLDEEVEPLLEQYGDVENVPEKEDE
jgi:hypothetical protein